RDPGALHVFIHSVNHSDDDLAESLAELSVDFEVTHEFVEQPILNPNGKRTLLQHPSRIAE
ncbi:MAG: hypothetical protein MK235_01505, partial [Candidatus Poseidoniales archaeon]|nr:hypothetical protein [Candidatus Poseidoniales archaeon]